MLFNSSYSAKHAHVQQISQSQCCYSSVYTQLNKLTDSKRHILTVKNSLYEVK